jgi:hypothetical protein
VTLAPSNSGATFNRFKPIKARYAVANCSTAAVTVSLDATSVSTAWAPIPIVPTPVPCAGASATLGAITLRAGAQNTVEFSVPAPATCPVGPGGAILQVDAVASGVGLKPLTSTAFYQIALKN